MGNIPLSKMINEMKLENGKLRVLTAKHPRKPGYGAGWTDKKNVFHKNAGATAYYTPCKALR